MPKKSKKRNDLPKVKKSSFFKKFFVVFFYSLGKLTWNIIKSPYYLIKWVYKLSRKTSAKVEETKTQIKRNSIKPVYSELKLIESIKGNYSKWENFVFKSDSKIGIIIGARGSGKTAIGVKILENVYAKTKKRCYAIGFHKEDFPSWINVVESVEQIQNNSFILIDEGGIYFSSRRSMSEANQFLSDLMLIARHKNLSVLFISQNSSNLDINILRQADYLVLKPSSLLQEEFERKIIQKIYEETEKDFEKYKDIKGITYIYSGDFKGFVSNPLPSFWDMEISKSFR
jgi:hypothetical protein